VSLQRGLPALGVLFAAFVLAACGRSGHGRLAVFVGHWSGHTRGIDIHDSGRGREYINSGAPPVATLTFNVLRVTGTPAEADARIRLTSVRIFDRTAFPRGQPHVGEVGTLRLRHGIVTDTITHVFYCAPKPAEKATCGL
jgi:hypothetical protein